MILVVDDSDIIIDWLRTVIEGAGYYYDAASDATIALYKIARLDYALVIVDLGLPDYSGDVLAEHIKELPAPRGDTPLVAMTGGSPLSPERRHLFLDCLQKPFLPGALKGIIATHARPPIRDLHLMRTAGGGGCAS